MRVCACGSFIRSNRNRICSKCRGKSKQKKNNRKRIVAEIIECSTSTDISDESLSVSLSTDLDSTENVSPQVSIDNESSIEDSERVEEETENSSLFFDLTFYKNPFVEIDSIFIQVNAKLFHNIKCNCTIYTKPSVFTIKKKKFLRIGWVQFLKTGFQCTLLASLINNWQNTYNNAYHNLSDDIKKYFMPLLPNSMDKISISNHFDKLICSILYNNKDFHIFLYGRGLKREIITKNIDSLLLNIKENKLALNSNETNLNDDNTRISRYIVKNERVDFAYNFYEHINCFFTSKNMKKNINKILNDFCAGNDNFNINAKSFRFFSEQYFKPDCCSITTTLNRTNLASNKIGELTLYYHNSLMFRDFLKDRVTVPSILGNQISAHCNLKYYDMNDFVKELSIINNTCLESKLIPRIEIRIFNMDYIEKLFCLLNYFIIHISDLIKPFDDNKNATNYINLLLKFYKDTTKLKEKILIEEILRSYFSGIDSLKTKHMIDNSILHLFADDSSKSSNQELTLSKLITEQAATLKLKRIFCSLCKNKSYFFLIKNIIELVEDKILDFIEKLMKKIIIPQIIFDFICECNTSSAYITYQEICYNDCKFYTIFNEGILKDKINLQNDKGELITVDEFYNYDELFTNFIDPLKIEALPPAKLIGENNIIKERSREFEKCYDSLTFSENLFTNLSEIFYKQDAHNNKKMIISKGFIVITLKLLLFISESSGLNINFKKEIVKNLNSWFITNNIKLFPLFTFTKIHTHNKNVFPWVKILPRENVIENGEDQITAVLDQIQGLQIEENIFMETIVIYNKITKGCTFPISRINEKLAHEQVYQEFISKNKSITREIWEKTFLLNRIFVLQNKEKYKAIIETATLNPKEYLKKVALITNNQTILNCTYQRLTRSLLYVMFSVTSFYTERPGILLKTVKKQDICEIIPIFGPIKPGKFYLVIDNQKVDILVNKLLD